MLLGLLRDFESEAQRMVKQEASNLGRLKREVDKALAAAAAGGRYLQKLPPGKLPPKLLSSILSAFEGAEARASVVVKAATETAAWESCEDGVRRLRRRADERLWPQLQEELCVVAARLEADGPLDDGKLLLSSGACRRTFAS